MLQYNYTDLMDHMIDLLGTLCTRCDKMIATEWEMNDERLFTGSWWNNSIKMGERWDEILLWFTMRFIGDEWLKLSIRFIGDKWFKLLGMNDYWRWMIQIIGDEWFKLSIRFIGDEWLKLSIRFIGDE
mgnify:CR=1 FL=1